MKKVCIVISNVYLIYLLYLVRAFPCGRKMMMTTTTLQALIRLIWPNPPRPRPNPKPSLPSCGPGRDALNVEHIKTTNIALRKG